MPATVGFGSDLMHGLTQAGVYTAVAQTVDLSGPDPEVGDVEYTNNDSPNNTREYLPGLIEPGEAEFEMIYTKAQANTLYTMFGNGIVYWWKVIYADGSAWNFPGYLNAFGTEAPTEDEAIRNTLGMKVTGKPTFTPSAAAV